MSDEELTKDERTDREDDILYRAAQQLMEHFGAVEILVTRHDPVSGDTWTMAKGLGDYNARYGMMRKWLARADAEIIKEMND